MTVGAGQLRQLDVFQIIPDIAPRILTQGLTASMGVVQAAQVAGLLYVWRTG